jgi:hypothetical protein
MYNGQIECSVCGGKGHIEIRGLTDMMPAVARFRQVSHSAFTGYMHFRCPRCHTLLQVDPVEVLGAETIRGVPERENVSRIMP